MGDLTSVFARAQWRPDGLSSLFSIFLGLESLLLIVKGTTLTMLCETLIALRHAKRLGGKGGMLETSIRKFFQVRPLVYIAGLEMQMLEQNTRKPVDGIKYGCVSGYNGDNDAWFVTNNEDRSGAVLHSPYRVTCPSDTKNWWARKNPSSEWETTGN